MDRAVSPADGKSVAASWRAAFVETSAKQNEKVSEVFLTAIDEIERKLNPSFDKKDECILL
jgi:Ras family protein